VVTVLRTYGDGSEGKHNEELHQHRQGDQIKEDEMHMARRMHETLQMHTEY
jgi:hypothetical protein